MDIPSLKNEPSYIKFSAETVKFMDVGRAMESHWACSNNRSYFNLFEIEHLIEYLQARIKIANYKAELSYYATEDIIDALTHGKWKFVDNKIVDSNLTMICDISHHSKEYRAVLADIIISGRAVLLNGGKYEK